MFVRLIPINGLIFLFAACNSVNPDTQGKAVPAAAASANCDRTDIKDSVHGFINDEFIANALKDELTAKLLDSIYHDVEKRTVLSANKYTPNTFDTIVTYKVECDSVVYLSSKANSFPLYVSIQSGRIRLNSGFVRSGMSKNEFIGRLNLDRNIADTIKITESEGNNDFIFVFVGNSLTRIIYNNLYVESGNG